MKMETGNSVRIPVPSSFLGISNIHVIPGTAHGKTWLTRHQWEVREPGSVSIGFGPEGDKNSLSSRKIATANNN